MYLKLVLLLTFLGGTWAICPPPEDIPAPCRCEEDRVRIYCSSNTNNVRWDITETFANISSQFPEDFIFEELVLEAINNQEIPAGAIPTMKFKSIRVNTNPQLRYIDPDAFGETTNVTTYLSVASNYQLRQKGPNDTGGDLFDLFRKFTQVTEIDAHLVLINSIPEGGFGPLPYLQRFILGSGGVLNRIGSRAFSQLPSLNFINLNSCEIGREEIADDAFDGMAPNVEVQMYWNQFDWLLETPFKALLDSAKVVNIGGNQCVWLGFWYCTDERFGCNEPSAWICQDVEKYQPKITGYFCTQDSIERYDDIWEYCAAQAKKN